MPARKPLAADAAQTRRKRRAMAGALLGALLVWVPLVGLMVQREVARHVADRLVRNVPPLTRSVRRPTVGPRRPLPASTSWAAWLDSTTLSTALEHANLGPFTTVQRADARGFLIETHSWPARCLVSGDTRTGHVRQACGWRWQTLEAPTPPATP